MFAFESVAVQQAVCQELTLPALPSCVLDRRMDKHRIVIIVDRTTLLDDVAKQRYNEGINYIFSDQKSFGRLKVFEIRANESQAKSSTVGCIYTVEPVDVESNHQGSYFYNIYKHFLSKLEKLFGIAKKTDPIGRKLRDDNAFARATAAASLRSLLINDDPTSSDTELLQTTVAAIAAQCSKVEQCDVFLYSDLLDSYVKRDFRMNANMHAAGVARAAELINEYRPEISKTLLTITAWGFGRDDAAPGVALENRKRISVKAFWAGFFETLTSHAAAGSNSQISDFFRRAQD